MPVTDSVTWLLRFLGFFLMFWGLKAVVKPLSVLADALPFLGNLVASGTGAIAFLGVLALSPLTVAVAWLYYRTGLLVCKQRLNLSQGQWEGSAQCDCHDADADSWQRLSELG